MIAGRALDRVLDLLCGRIRTDNNWPTTARQTRNIIAFKATLDRLLPRKGSPNDAGTKPVDARFGLITSMPELP